MKAEPIAPEDMETLRARAAAADALAEALESLLAVAQTQLDQSATHDGLTNCKKLAAARAALRGAISDYNQTITTK